MGIRKTVALMVRTLYGEYFYSIVKGARMAADEKKINLLVIPGGVLGEDRASNILYHLAVQSSVDSIACTTGAIVTDDSGYELFRRESENKPALIIADKYEGFASIYYDNTSGIRQVMDYLINEKDCRRILMFAGPEISGDAEERLAEYRRCMEINHLRVEERMIGRGDHSPYCVEAARKLIEDNPGAEAIVCSDDYQAQAVYRVLRDMDIEIGKDIFVTGFDDIGDSAYMSPPLASVRASVIKLGYETCTLAGRMGEGEQSDGKVMECTFIKRASAGFDPNRTIAAFEDRRNISATSEFDIPSLTSAIVDFVFTGDVHDYQAECQKKLIEDFFFRLMNTYLGDVVRRGSARQLEYSLTIFDRGGTEYIDSDRLFRILDNIYRIFCERHKSDAARMELVGIISSIKRRVADNLEKRSGDIRKIVSSQHESVTRFSNKLLSIDPTSEHRYRELMEAMPLIGVMNASIFMYEEPIEQTDEMFRLPEKVYLKAYRDRTGAHEVDEAHQATDISDIMDYRYLEGGMNHVFFTMGLHYGR
jgi:LacI family transcriptional regulator